MEATLNGKILVDHKINLNEPIGGDGRILLDIISKYDDLEDSSWYVDTVVDSEDVLSLQKEYVVVGQYNNHDYYDYKLKILLKGFNPILQIELIVLIVIFLPYCRSLGE